MGLLNRKPNPAKLQKKYEKLMSEWHRLSTINRSASDEKYAEAQEILNQIESLQNS
ncbi:MAG: Lacal_2735 family protein [Bacteroidia bacterium]|nr:Lacal_2735 family protein [Bacteroidia bacterium]